MPVIHFYFDFVSPYAYVAFHALPRTLFGLPYHVVYRPLALGALLKAHGTPVPVGLPPKREWIFRHAAWLAREQGLEFAVPVVHPFSSIPWLRMALAASPQGQPGRHVCETLFNAIWQGSRDADDPAQREEVWQELVRDLPAVRDPADAAVKQELFAVGEAAIAHGVFGVPTCVLVPEDEDGTPEVFWGVEGLPMLREAVLARATTVQATEA